MPPKLFHDNNDALKMLSSKAKAIDMMSSFTSTSYVMCLGRKKRHVHSHRPIFYIFRLLFYPFIYLFIYLFIYYYYYLLVHLALNNVTQFYKESLFRTSHMNTQV
jgi:hypothetical protein